MERLLFKKHAGEYIQCTCTSFLRMEAGVCDVPSGALALPMIILPSQLSSVTELLSKWIH